VKKNKVLGSPKRLVVCLANANFAAPLELRKIYHCPGKVKVGASTLLRIVDESGEEYLYPQELFAPVRVAPSVQEALTLAS
jgi:hypothetical protein